MIKKIKSSLSVKVFMITALLMTACCSITYLCITQFAPYIYTHDLSEVDEVIPYFTEEISHYLKDDAIYAIGDYSYAIADEFDDEFAIHLFQSDGKEIALPEIDTPMGREIASSDMGFTGKEITQFNRNDTTQWCKLTFEDDTEEYTLFIAKNTDKESQVVEALQKSLPVLSVIIIVVSITAAFFYTIYMTTPIKRISKISKQMAALDFGGLCTVRRTDEIGILAGSLNDLSEKLSSALSELQSANKQLQADIDKERELERQRIDFFSAASHELKTPITIIKGQLQGMLCGVGRYKDRETYLAESLEVTNTLEQMVQELLTVSRLETPEYTYTKSRFDLSLMLSDRLAAFDDLFVQKELTLDKALSPEIYLMGDAQLLQKVVDNLIDNAIAYSPVQNKIMVSLWTAQGKVFLSIENTGVHIPEEAIPKLFEAFYRVDGSRNRRTGGSGLGLYIVKTILDLHGAEIKIENTSQGVKACVRFST